MKYFLVFALITLSAVSGQQNDSDSSSGGSASSSEESNEGPGGFPKGPGGFPGGPGGFFPGGPGGFPGGPGGFPGGPGGFPGGPGRPRPGRRVDHQCLNSTLNSTEDTTISMKDTMKLIFALEITRVSPDATETEVVTAITDAVKTPTPDNETNLNNVITNYIACVFSHRDGGSTTTQAPATSTST